MHICTVDVTYTELKTLSKRNKMPQNFAEGSFSIESTKIFHYISCSVSSILLFKL